MRITILDEAEQDLIDGYRFYEANGAGLGEYFLDSIFSDIDSLQVYAGVHARHFGFHRLLARRFPYAVYYLVEKRTVRVFAILDCRRDPQRIKRRLDNRSR